MSIFSPISRMPMQAMPPASGRTPQAPKPDQVKFGGPNAENRTAKNKKETDTPAKPSFTTAAKNALKAAFEPWGLAKDFGVGLLLAVATVIIPPHAHALAMIPFSFIFGIGWRGTESIYRTYKPQVIIESNQTEAK